MSRLKKQSSGTITGVLLPLGMICLFAFCSMFLLLTGLSVYRELRQGSDSVFGSTVAYSYLHTKLSQSNTEGAISLREEEGTQVLVISNPNQGENPYETRIYFFGGKLCELFTPASEPFDPALGTTITALLYCSFSIDGSLFEADMMTVEEESIHMAFGLVGGSGL
jgi:hypothetical protein